MVKLFIALNLVDAKHVNVNCILSKKCKTKRVTSQDNMVKKKSRQDLVFGYRSISTQFTYNSLPKFTTHK